MIYLGGTQVYMTLTELRNFVRGVASALGLPAEGATTAAAMAALHARLAAPASSQGACQPHGMFLFAPLPVPLPSVSASCACSQLG